METDKLRIIITGGGTGGHIFPGVAIIKELEKICNTDILWIGTGRPIEMKALENTGWAHKTLNVKPIMGMGLSGAFMSFFNLPVNILSAVKAIIKFNPHIVLGVGGYVSGPVIMASKFLGKKTVIHEQNLKPGLSNRLSAKFSDVIFTSFKETGDFFSDKNVIFTGNPIRKEILTAANNKFFSADKDFFKILVAGGSQGASGLNRLVSSAIQVLNNSGVKIDVIHQSGKNDKAELEEFYKKNNINNVRVYDFITDMGSAYNGADLVICRAGATTISEITAVGKPSIFIPFPHATGGHQDENAKKIEDAGAALFFRQDEIGAVKLASEIELLINNPERLKEMSLRSKELGRINAAEDIAENIIKIVNSNLSKKNVTIKIRNLTGQLI